MDYEGRRPNDLEYRTEKLQPAVNTAGVTLFGLLAL